MAHRCVEDPDTILSLGGPVPELVRREGTSSLRSLGSFENVRHEVRWRGGLLEVDETRYEHGTLYEVECETDNPEGVKGLLEEDLRGAGVSFSDGVTSKFANFVNKTLL